MPQGGIRREIVRKESGWSKAERAQKIAKLCGQEYGIVKKDSPLTFDVNEGTYMHRFKFSNRNGISRKIQIKKYVKLLCILGWIELTAKLEGTKCGFGMWGVQHWVKKGGLGGPHNTTCYVKNG